MINTLPAQEIKRRGGKAIELALKQGPVYIITNNVLSCIVLKEEEYARLVASSMPRKKKQKNNLLQWLLQRKPSQSKSREEIDARINEERDGLDRR